MRCSGGVSFIRMIAMIQDLQAEEVVAVIGSAMAGRGSVRRMVMDKCMC